MNARFWIWWNDGWCKLTLRPGQSVTMYTGKPTDEGFSCEAQTYEYDGETVASEINTWGADCDGRHEWHGESSCTLEGLHGIEGDEYGPDRPDWQRGRSSQRDQYAELAGY